MLTEAEATTLPREPYVGPRPFERDDSGVFFGREQEVEDVLSLVVAHPTFVLYAASGAGKSSLLNAGLIPRLEDEGFDVLPPARVLGTFDAAAGDAVQTNIYSAGVLSHWEEDAASRHASLRSFLDARPRGDDDEGFPEPRAVILDQFEEVFTLHPARWRERAAFFDEIREALDADQLLRVVIAIREDYVAHLDPYAPRLPEALRTRFRLERLRRGPAIAAVEGPLRHTGRRLAEGVAEALVDDLLTTRIESADGRTVEVRGEFVEPVHLQVACQSLWSGLAPGIEEITEAELRMHGDLDQVLRRFYAEAVQEAVRHARVREPTVRSWVERALITPGGTRGTAYSEAKSTAGLPNAAVRALAEKRLIRSEWRAGAHWYELTHDRLIEPIRAANREYFSRRSRTRLRRVVGGFTALVALLATVIGLLFATWPGLKPTARVATLRLVTSDSNVGFSQYLQRLNESARGFSTSELQRVGNLYTLAVQITGQKGKRLAVRWSVVHATSGDEVSSSGRAPAFSIAPQADNLTAQVSIWVPLPDSAGRYFVQVELEEDGTSAGRLLARVRSAPFDVAGDRSTTSCTIQGTAGPDRLVGTATADVLGGGAGNDVLEGRGGDDVRDGGPGSDSVRGGSGNDLLQAADGRPDELLGGPGTDDASYDLGLDSLRDVEVQRAAGIAQNIR